jgi:hypothetical protein
MNVDAEMVEARIKARYRHIRVCFLSAIVSIGPPFLLIVYHAMVNLHFFKKEKVVFV